MFRKLIMKAYFLTALLVIPLILGTGSNVSANEPPPPGTRLSGPAILGTLTLTREVDENGLEIGTNISFVGTCKGKNALIEPFVLPYALATITEEDLEGFTLDVGPPGCVTIAGGESLIINTVTKFTRVGEVMIQAEVVMLYLIF